MGTFDYFDRKPIKPQTAGAGATVTLAAPLTAVIIEQQTLKGVIDDE